MDVNNEEQNNSSSSSSGGISAEDLIAQGRANRSAEVSRIFNNERDPSRLWTTRNRSANSANDDGGRRVRQRSDGEMTPLDINLINSSMMRRSNPITLGELLNSNITEISRDGYLDLMLLRSIANGRHGQTNYMVKLINARGGNKSNSSN